MLRILTVPLIRSQDTPLDIRSFLPSKVASMFIALHSLACSVPFISVVSAVALQPRFRYPIPSPLDPSKASGVADLTSLDLVGLNASASMECEGDWGRDLSIESCSNALDKIPRNSARLSFRQRGTGNPDVLLPARFLSGTWLLISRICAVVSYPQICLFERLRYCCRPSEANKT